MTVRVMRGVYHSGLFHARGVPMRPDRYGADISSWLAMGGVWSASSHTLPYPLRGFRSLRTLSAHRHRGGYALKQINGKRLHSPAWLACVCFCVPASAFCVPASVICVPASVLESVSAFAEPPPGGVTFTISPPPMLPICNFAKTNRRWYASRPRDKWRQRVPDI